jgi:putative intracellular protease/amidase
MGGLRATPDLTLDNLDPATAAILILPGSQSWLDPAANTAVMSLLSDLRSGGVLLAAICGATLALARLGLLDTVAHTSNGPGFLGSHAPAYAGRKLYRADALAVADGGIVTAAGHGAIEFAYEIILALAILDPATAKQWFDLFKHGVVPPPEFWSQT